MAAAVAAVGALVLICSRSVAVEAVYPVERAARAVRLGFWPRVTGLFRGSAASAENVRLRREVASLRVLHDDVRRLTDENARLRRALGYAARQPGAWIPAGVLSRGGGAAAVRLSLRVDRGTLDGVREGAVVVVPEGLVGRVASVTPHTADVRLVTDPALMVACEIETGSPQNANAVLCGGGDTLVVRYLGGADGFPSRARVFTSGRGGVFPRGIEIGTFLSLTNDVRGVKGEVLPRVDYATLEDVFIRHGK